MTGLADKQLTCRDCGQVFLFTIGEQEFFTSRGFENTPGHCPACRLVRRERRSGMGERTKHDVTCAACGSATQVPFLPTQGRPVYCGDCFGEIHSRN